MIEFFIMFIFILILATVVTITMMTVVNKNSNAREASKYIIDQFIPDNTDSDLNKLIQFTKKNPRLKYHI